MGRERRVVSVELGRDEPARGTPLSAAPCRLTQLKAFERYFPGP